jgi:hypothetical protein
MPLKEVLTKKAFPLTAKEYTLPQYTLSVISMKTLQTILQNKLDGLKDFKAADQTLRFWNTKTTEGRSTYLANNSHQTARRSGSVVRGSFASEEGWNILADFSGDRLFLRERTKISVGYTR